MSGREDRCNRRAPLPQGSKAKIRFTGVDYAASLGMFVYASSVVATPIILLRIADELSFSLAGGGDTDTNACIVGGLNGALHGIDGIPHRMVHAVYNCDVALGQPRRPYLQTWQVLDELIAGIV